tara:strand:+ start:709 stop:987 length:279 start_codon:yes stop_codon:yes gene_type:complete
MVKLVEHCELSIYGDEMERWSPTSTTTKNLLVNRVDKLLDEIGLSSRKDILLYEKIRLIAYNLGISFWTEESDSDSDEDGDNKSIVQLIEEN